MSLDLFNEPPSDSVVRWGGDCKYWIGTATESDLEKFGIKRKEFRSRNDVLSTNM